MAKTAVTQWDTTAANNTDVGSIGIQGTNAISNADNAFREIMAQIATFITGATFTGITTLGSSAFITSTAAGTLLSLTSTDSGGASGPDAAFYRASSSPAAFDLGMAIRSYLNNASFVKKEYGTIYNVAQAVTAGAEDGAWDIHTVRAGTLASRMVIMAGMYMTGATGTDKGAGTINATGYYLNGTALPTAAYATAAQYRANTASLTLQTDAVWSAAAEVTLTDAATIAVDMNTFINAVVTLAGNRAMGNPSNEKVGQSGCIRIVQDGAGSRTLSYGTDWEFAGGTAPVLSTAAGSNDLLFYYVIATNRVYGNLIKAVV